MSLPLPEKWYCCLHPIEQQTTFLAAASMLPVFPFIQEDVFRTLWSASGGTLDDPRFNAYVGLYTLGLVELEFEGELLDFYQFDVIDWTRIQLFIAAGGSSCSGGCSLRPAYSLP